MFMEYVSDPKKKVHEHDRFYPALYSQQKYTSPGLLFHLTLSLSAVLSICTFIVSALGKLENLHRLLTLHLTFHINPVNTMSRLTEAYLQRSS